jgi:hypothetical protein
MPSFLVAPGWAGSLGVFRPFVASDGRSTLEAARFGDGGSIQLHKNLSNAAVTVSETAGHRATVVSALEKPGAYGVGFEEPFAENGARRPIYAVSSTKLNFLKGVYGERVGSALRIS